MATWTFDFVTGIDRGIPLEWYNPNSVRLEFTPDSSVPADFEGANIERVCTHCIVSEEVLIPILALTMEELINTYYKIEFECAYALYEGVVLYIECSKPR